MAIFRVGGNLDGFGGTLPPAGVIANIFFTIPIMRDGEAAVIPVLYGFSDVLQATVVMLKVFCNEIQRQQADTAESQRLRVRKITGSDEVRAVSH